jgi:lipoprotein-anchoring transpeptidase ErfK/SrfK
MRRSSTSATHWFTRAALPLTAAAALALGAAGPAHADPVAIPGVDPDMVERTLRSWGIVPQPTPPAAPQPAAPAAPAVAVPAPFSPPSVNPASGEVVGVAQPIIINFDAPIQDRAAAERAIQVTSSPSVTGSFHWFSNRQVRWRPAEFWPAHTQVTVTAGGTTSSFSTGDAVVAVADDATKTITVTSNGQVVRTMPTSMGKNSTPTPNGTYIVGEQLREMWMDSSTYGVPVDAPEGYRVHVEYATRLSNSGIFIHGAPWSVDSQGYANVSHGCLNVSTENARWIYENMGKGDPVIVRNTVGGTLNGYDGLGDWNL